MKVSVIIPLYNKALHIRQAIESVLNQTFSDLEIIVVDDGSTDGGNKIVDAIKDPRIKLIQQPNSGAAAARNTGIKKSQGKYIAFLDADDIWLPRNLSLHLELLSKHPNLCWSGGLYDCILSGGNMQKGSLPKELEQMIKDDVIPDAVLFLEKGSYFCTDTVLIERKILGEVGLIDTNLKVGEDVDLWLRIALKYPSLTYCKKSIAQYRLGIPSSLMTTAFDTSKEQSTLLFVRKYLALAEGLSKDRAAAIRTICKRRLKGTIAKLILERKNSIAKSLLNEFGNLLGSQKIKYKMSMKIPTSLLRFILRLIDKRLSRRF